MNGLDYGLLTRLAARYATDKGGEGGHEFTHFYETRLRTRRFSTLRVLEVGILDGGSLAMWADYFPRAQVCGIDLVDYSQPPQPPCWSHVKDRIRTNVADQGSRDALLMALADFGPGAFDLVVDDGGHRMNEQQVTLGVLWQVLAPGGIYILEDLHTSRSAQPKKWGVLSDVDNTTLSLVEHLAGAGYIPPAHYLRAEELERLQRQVESVTIFERGPLSMTCMIEKEVE